MTKILLCTNSHGRDFLSKFLDFAHTNLKIIFVDLPTRYDLKDWHCVYKEIGKTKTSTTLKDSEILR